MRAGHTCRVSVLAAGHAVLSSDDDPALGHAPASAGQASTVIRERPSQDERARTGPVEPTVLKTKFSVPRGPTTMVSRGRLLDALDAGVQGPLTLLAAPPVPARARC